MGRIIPYIMENVPNHQLVYIYNMHVCRQYRENASYIMRGLIEQKW